MITRDAERIINSLVDDNQANRLVRSDSDDDEDSDASDKGANHGKGTDPSF